jgi:hypothetical protein
MLSQPKEKAFIQENVNRMWASSRGRIHYPIAINLAAELHKHIIIGKRQPEKPPGDKKKVLIWLS